MPADGDGAGSPGSDRAELQQALLQGEEAREDMEEGPDSKFAFSWRSLLLHVG